MTPKCSLAKTALALFCLIWVIFCIRITLSIAESYRNGNWHYENVIYRPDLTPFGDLDRNGHITSPNHAPPRPISGKTPKRLCEGPIDVVFTWVNGSDPEQQERLRKYHGDPDRLSIMYRDYGTLRFAIRSIEKFAPWINHVFLLTNGQMPNWYNKSANKFVSTVPFIQLQQFLVNPFSFLFSEQNYACYS